MIFVYIAICLALILFRRKKLIFLFICFLGLLTGINAMQNLCSEKPVLKVCLTGKTEMREMHWKNPNGTLKHSSIECHEVIFQQINGEEIARFSLCGDLIGVRAKILRFPPFLNAIGISNQYKWDAVYTGYRRAEDYQEFPVEAHSLAKTPSTVFRSLLFKCWNALFFNRTHSFLFKSANLQSNYFPTVDESGNAIEAEYTLSLSSAGLSATNLNGTLERNPAPSGAG